jgi:hypothetical protein
MHSHAHHFSIVCIAAASYQTLSPRHPYSSIIPPTSRLTPTRSSVRWTHSISILTNVIRILQHKSHLVILQFSYHHTTLHNITASHCTLSHTAQHNGILSRCIPTVCCTSCGYVIFECSHAHRVGHPPGRASLRRRLLALRASVERQRDLRRLGANGRRDERSVV